LKGGVYSGKRTPGWQKTGGHELVHKRKKLRRDTPRKLAPRSYNKTKDRKTHQKRRKNSDKVQTRRGAWDKKRKKRPDRRRGVVTAG